MDLKKKHIINTLFSLHPSVYENSTLTWDILGKAQNMVSLPQSGMPDLGSLGWYRKEQPGLVGTVETHKEHGTGKAQPENNLWEGGLQLEDKDACS